MDCSPPGSSVHGIFPDKNTGVSCHFLLQLCTLQLLRSLDLSNGVPDVCGHSLHWGHVMKLWGRRDVCNRRQQWFQHPPLPFHFIKDFLDEQIIYSHGAQQKHFQHCTHWSKTVLWKQSVFQGESKPTATAQEKKLYLSYFLISVWWDLGYKHVWCCVISNIISLSVYLSIRPPIHMYIT